MAKHVATRGSNTARECMGPVPEEGVGGGVNVSPREGGKEGRSSQPIETTRIFEISGL